MSNDDIKTEVALIRNDLDKIMLGHSELESKFLHHIETHVQFNGLIHTTLEPIREDHRQLDAKFSNYIIKNDANMSHLSKCIDATNLEIKESNKVIHNLTENVNKNSRDIMKIMYAFGAVLGLIQLAILLKEFLKGLF